MLRERAYAKLNLVLHVGRPREDGMHPLCSLFASLELADELTATRAAEARDTVACPAVEGPNLALAAIEAFRSRPGGRELPPLQVKIDKRIPVAAGLGGGSADAAAALRIANAAAGDPLSAEQLRLLAADLGSDVPSQVEPRHALVQGTGERIEPVELPPLAVVLVPSAEGLSTAGVYAELDRLECWREQLEPEPLRRLAGAAPEDLARGLDNDLQHAALSLRPELAGTLDRLAAAGALGVAVSGSGPTCFGLFTDHGAAGAAAGAIPGALLTALRGA